MAAIDPEYLSDTTSSELEMTTPEESSTSFSSSDDDDSSSPEQEANDCWQLPKHDHACCEYTGKGGFNEDVLRDLSNKSVLEAYERFVDTEVVQFIVEETNRYALDKLEGQWEPLTALELQKVLALLVWMLIVVPCSRADILWSDDPYLQVTLPKQVMPDGERFEKVLRMLHFFNNEHIGAHVDKAACKVKQLTDMMVSRFQAAFTPQRDLVVVDKVLMPYKSFRILRVASPSSYTWNVKALTGLEPGSAEYRAEARRSIMELVTPVAYGGRTLYMAKVHMSVGLANELLKCKTNSVGVLHPYKGGAPVSLVKQKVTRDKMVEALENSQGVRVLKCNTGGDKYLFLTTVHDAADIVDTIEKKGKVRRYPRAAFDYGKIMEALDQIDEMMPPVIAEDGENGRSALKWYQRYGLELVVGYSVINAYLLYNAANHDDEAHAIQQREFNLRLVKEMLNKCGVEVAPVPVQEPDSDSERSPNTFSFESDEAMLSGGEGHSSSD